MTSLNATLDSLARATLKLEKSKSRLNVTLRKDALLLRQLLLNLSPLRLLLVNRELQVLVLLVLSKMKSPKDLKRLREKVDSWLTLP
jgi:hypothetical protein